MKMNTQVDKTLKAGRFDPFGLYDSKKEEKNITIGLSAKK